MRRCLDLPDPFEVVVSVGSHGAVDAMGPYAERYWLPHIGPSAYLAARCLIAFGDSKWEKATLAAALGIGHSAGVNSTLERALARLDAFRLATDMDGILYVRRYWPRLPANLLAKMLPALRVGEAEAAA